MKAKEECVAAMQNIGAALFVIGLFIMCTVESIVLCTIGLLMLISGVVMISIAEKLMDRLEEEERRKERWEEQQTRTDMICTK